MSKKINNKSTKKLTESIQPKNIFPTKTFASEESKVIYKEMMAIYEKLCKKDRSFHLVFLNKELQSEMFYRVCEPAEKERFNKSVSTLACNMYLFLCDIGYIKSLQEAGYLTLTEKGQHKTLVERQTDLNER